MTDPADREGLVPTRRRPPGYTYNKRWRLAHPEARYAEKARYYRKTTDAPNRRGLWTSADMDAITADNRPTDSILSSQIGRSVRSIQCKRHKMLTDPEGAS